MPPEYRAELRAIADRIRRISTSLKVSEDAEAYLDEAYDLIINASDCEL